MRRGRIAFALTFALAATAFEVRAFEPIVILASDFARASGNPTLQVWERGSTAVPVWSLSGQQAGQSISAVTPPLPKDCGGVKIELLVIGTEAAGEDKSDVFRVDVGEIAAGTAPRVTSGKPVRSRVPAVAWTARWVEVESYVVVKGGSSLCLKVRREVEDAANTFRRPDGLVQARVTPLPKLPVAFTVEQRPGYNSWPMIAAVGKRLICTYSRGSAHDIGEGRRDAYARTSVDGGRTWTDEVAFANDPQVGEVMIGKGLDLDGAALFWVRCIGRPKSHHDLYRTRDGVRFEKIAEPTLKPFPMQITDVFHVGRRLMALWFATNYRDEGEHAWGTLASDDNGLTWQQTTVETVTKKSELPTEPSVVNLGGGRLLGLARTETGGDSLASEFQLTSTDGGATWRKTRTNIRDVLASSPSLILDTKSGRVFVYYYERGRHVVKVRVAKADEIFERPFDWPMPKAVLEGDEERPWDAGNVNAVEQGGRHYLAYYSGNATNTTVYVGVSGGLSEGCCP